MPVPRCYALVVGDRCKERGLVSIVRQNGEEVRYSNKGRMVCQGAPTKPATLRPVVTADDPLTEYGYMGDDYIVLEYGTTRWNRFLREIEYAE